MEELQGVSAEQMNETAAPAAQMQEVAAPAAAAAEDPIASTGTFTEEEQAQIKAYADTINIKDTKTIIEYGSGVQKQMADFSESVLQNVRTHDLGEVGSMLTGVISDLKSFEPGAEEEKGGFFGLFKKPAKKISEMKTEYDKASANVDKVARALQQHQITLLKDVDMLDQMYASNLAYYKNLSMYIAAGKAKIAQDLELTRMVALQTAPQIRMIQSNDTTMVEKIQSTLVNTIPLWKNQMVLALGLEDSTKAAKAESEVTDMTNKLLMSNAEKLKQTTIATAKASERGIVDLETLKQTNASLIATLDEVAKIQTEGRSARAAAEQELRNMEDELRRKLLNMQPAEPAPQAPAYTPAVDLNAAPDKAPWEK